MQNRVKRIVGKARRLRKQERKCKALKIMPSIAESQFPWSKNSIPMPFDTEVRGSQRTHKFVLKCANFRPLEPPATLLTSIEVSHKLNSRKKI